jgi:antitoxin component of MazEF toxin-antitoxin module
MEGKKVRLAVEDGHIVISPLPRVTTLSDLVADLTHDDLAEAFDRGPDQGREIVECEPALSCPQAPAASRSTIA